MQCGDTVNGVATDGREVCHPDLLAAVLADQRHPAEPVLVAGETGAYLVEEPAVDFVDDLEVAGQRLAEHRQRPGLQRLGQQGVVGVAESRDGDLPRLVPVQLAVVDQQPHELSHRDRGVGVIELQGEPLGEFPDPRFGQVVHDVQHVLQRAGHEEVLLEQTQPLARLRLVVGVQHLGDRLRGDLVLDCLVVVAGVEGCQRERLDGPGAPQRQHVAGVDAVALDGRVVGDAFQHSSRHPPGAVVAGLVGVVLGVAAPLDQVADIGFGDLPGVSVRQPVVGLLNLPAVADLLVEDAELVADAVADCRTLEGGQRVQVARRKPAQTAVAQSGLFLAGQDLVELLAHRPQRVLCRLLHLEVQQVVAQLRAHQEFGRQVAGHLAAEIERGLRRRHPAVLHAVTHGQSESPVVVLGPQGRGRTPDRVADVIGDRPL